MPQDQTFLSEGDAWYRRNRDKDFFSRDDVIFQYVTEHLKPQKILDVGCSDGARLNRLATSVGAKGYGIDPSHEAITSGTKQFPDLELTHGLAHTLPYDNGFFDLITIRYVFHWVERTKLLQTVSEIDRVLAENGLLIIYDFDPHFPCRIRYHHLPNEDVYTYKQPHWDMFRASNTYGTVFMQECLHDGVFDPMNLMKMVVLQKRSYSQYPLITL